MQPRLPVSLDSGTNTGYVVLWVMTHSFEVFGNTISYFVTKISTEEHFMTSSLP